MGHLIKEGDGKLPPVRVDCNYGNQGVLILEIRIGQLQKKVIFLPHQTLPQISPQLIQIPSKLQTTRVQITFWLLRVL